MEELGTDMEERQSSTQKRLLIIDDDPLVCHYISQVGERMGFSCSIISEPKLIKTEIEPHSYDVIILDLQMPNVDGIEILRFLAENDCQVPILLNSGSDPRVVMAAKRLGELHNLRMAGVLLKPIGPAELRKALVDVQSNADINVKGKKGQASGQRDTILPAETPAADPTVTADELREALDNFEIITHYQPKVEMKSGQIVGAEALARWSHPRHGLIRPDLFIPIAEKFGMIDFLTEKVLHAVLKDMTEWNQAGFNIIVSVNFATKTLCNLEFPEKFDSLLAEYGVNLQKQLVIEVTETQAMEDLVQVMDVLSRLRLKGVGLSIDDFGTGYSSMTALREMPFTEMKIDKSFVLNSVSHDDSRVLVNSVIELGHSMGTTVVAEGVETYEIWELVRSLGCDLAQGYYMSRPVASAEFSKLVARWNPRDIL